MSVSPLAGKPAPADQWIRVEQIEQEYLRRRPDPNDPRQSVIFGTGGHRGTPLDGSFTESHILAITQAICEYRKSRGIDGPLLLGKDTHAASTPAQRTALEVLAANGVQVRLQKDDGYTPTPVISRAILVHNRGRADGLADGIIVTPSHNPPTDGGFKYNPPHGGGADTDVTAGIQDRANEILQGGNQAVRRIDFDDALRAPTTEAVDFSHDYIQDLENVIDMAAIREAGVRIGVDPLGGASVHYWRPIADHYGLDLTVVSPDVDKTFSFMPVDHDGKIRMDCSSPWAMTHMVALKDQYDLAFGNDPDADRHGIVTPSVGLMNPNHYLAVAIEYLFRNRPHWSADAQIGKTLVSSSMIDRVARDLGRTVCEVPVGFKWFVEGLHSGRFGFAGEESAGGSFLRFDASVWTTDKDGILLDLLAAEIVARTGRDPGLHYAELAERHGTAFYARYDQPATLEEKAILRNLSPDAVKATTLAGDRITASWTIAPGNGAAIGGLKVATEQGWFAARPSGTERIYKIYAESFTSETHLAAILDEAKQIVADALAAR